MQPASPSKPPQTLHCELRWWNSNLVVVPVLRAFFSSGIRPRYWRRTPSMSTTSSNSRLSISLSVHPCTPLFFYFDELGKPARHQPQRVAVLDLWTLPLAHHGVHRLGQGAGLVKPLDSAAQTRAKEPSVGVDTMAKAHHALLEESNLRPCYYQWMILSFCIHSLFYNLSWPPVYASFFS